MHGEGGVLGQRCGQYQSHVLHFLRVFDVVVEDSVGALEPSDRREPRDDDCEGGVHFRFIYRILSAGWVYNIRFLECSF